LNKKPRKPQIAKFPIEVVGATKMGVDVSGIVAKEFAAYERPVSAKRKGILDVLPNPTQNLRGGFLTGDR
jgi:hypothetical protein